MLGALPLLLLLQTTQTTQATIAGAVRDAQTGGPLGGAIVVLTELDRTTVADGEGRYALRDVPAGPHHLTVRFIGYAPRSLHALVPRDGRLEINVSLRPQPVRLQTLEVRGSNVVRGIASGDSLTFPDRGASIAAIRDDPRLAEADVLQTLGGGDVVLRPESPSGIHVRGGAANQTAYLLDGIPVFSPVHAAGVFSAWNPDAVSWIDLSAAAPSPADPYALSGTVAAITRTPGAQIQAQGGASNTQARFAIDGPLPFGAGFLVSLRSGFPGAIAKKEASYLRSESGDRLAKLEAPAFGGRLLLLGYDSENEVGATAQIGTQPGLDTVSRNGFEWRSQSWGGAWRGVLGSVGVQVRAWSAAGQAASRWAVSRSPVSMASTRRDEGFLVAVERRASQASTALGVRIERTRTAYRVASDSAAFPAAELQGRTAVAALFVQHARTVAHGFDLHLGTSLATAGRALYLSPRAQVRWRTAGGGAERVTLSASYARLHQFTQSLRNEESVVGNVFPVDLYVSAGTPGVPVARGDQAVLAADYRPIAGLSLGAQAYARASRGVVLVAPSSGEPFSLGTFTVGSQTSRGVSLNAAVTGARYSILASYGFQQVRLSFGARDSAYVPDHGARHLLEGGIIVFPSASSSIRLGVTSALGRRTTAVADGLEWEACNLLDRGCEFGGSPHYDGSVLGGTRLPVYVRVDLGVRKHWHISVGGRDAMIAVFGTMTNVLNRINVLTYARNPATGQLAPIEMRPLAPLVVGIDWRF